MRDGSAGNGRMFILPVRRTGSHSERPPGAGPLSKQHPHGAHAAILLRDREGGRELRQPPSRGQCRTLGSARGMTDGRAAATDWPLFTFWMTGKGWPTPGRTHLYSLRACTIFRCVCFLLHFVYNQARTTHFFFSFFKETNFFQLFSLMLKKTKNKSVFGPSTFGDQRAG